MAVTKAYMSWTRPETDVLGLWVDDRTLGDWLAFSTDDDLVALLLEVDDNDERTGRVAGLEIVGFLEFDRWEMLPDLGMVWQVADWEPMPLVDLLKREQENLRREQREGAA
jgi:hypothetical protein